VSRPSLVRLVSLVSTVFLCWAALSIGRESSGSALVPGDLAVRTYTAAATADVEDAEETERKREEAAAAVAVVYSNDVASEEGVRRRVDELLELVSESILGDSASGSETVEDPIPPVDDTSDGTEVVTTAVLTGRLFFDVDGDRVLEETETDSYRADFGLAGVGVAAIGDSAVVRGVTGADGSYTLEVPTGEIRVVVDATSGDLPEGVVADPAAVTVDCGAAECSADALIARADFLDQDSVVTGLQQETRVDGSTLATLALLAQRDFVAAVSGDVASPLVAQIRFVIKTRLDTEFRAGIKQEDLPTVRSNLQGSPPLIQPPFPDDLLEPSQLAAAGVIDTYLVPNSFPDEVATEAARQEARSQVEPVTVTVLADQKIVDEGEPLDAFMIEAISRTDADRGDAVPQAALATVVAVLVAVLAYYLARFRTQFWAKPRMVTLFGGLLVLAALAVRGASAMEAAEFSIYALPAVAFGYLAAVLFDNRMGTLMALGMAVLAAAGTEQTGVTVYALLATLAPLGLVSSASTRHAYRNSVVISAAIAGVIAAATAWLFYADPNTSPLTEVGQAAVWGFGVSLVAALLIQPVLAMLESWFDITTTLRLLDLTDRNHEALLVLQDKAFGTFNHSLMVGTLADAAARAVGANALLARAAAYYHDLGKTENPLFFIENQFGISNPHDDLTPEESAEVIRRHVLDGLELAKKYRIPTEVTEGILTHHGDGIMRYFYEKARSNRGGDVDIADFRHAGHKPRSREMAIVMMADSVEGACRAAFRDEDPSADVIAKVINRVVDEKVGDGQLSECDLTMGELTRVRGAFLDALVGHYHQRIAYPNFPGT
jgi:putative nucleotidyltransferase with HDIG domain